MAKEIHVFVELVGAVHQVGNLWLHERQGVERAFFRYSTQRSTSWLRRLRTTICALHSEGEKAPRGPGFDGQTQAAGYTILATTIRMIAPIR